MVNTDDIIPDLLADVAGAVIQALQNRTTWGAEQKALLGQLRKMLARKGYIGFIGHPRDYRLTVIGSSYLFDVPHTQPSWAPQRVSRTAHPHCLREFWTL